MINGKALEVLALSGLTTASTLVTPAPIQARNTLN